MKNRGEKAGQMHISFGMIFSIILIIAFLAFAIYGIMWMLDTQKIAKVGTFMENFQSDVDSLWRGTYGTQTHEYPLPKEIEYVCLRSVNEYQEDLFFYPREHGINIQTVNISHLDLDKTISAQNKAINPLGREFYDEYSEDRALCIKNNDEKIVITITKNYGEKAVTVSRG